MSSTSKTFKELESLKKDDIIRLLLEAQAKDSPSVTSGVGSGGDDSQASPKQQSSCPFPLSDDKPSDWIIAQIKTAVVEAVHDLKTELRLEYQARLKELDKKFSSELSSIRSEMTNLNNKVESKLKNFGQEVLNDLRETENRRNNLMIFGLKEDNSVASDNKDADLRSIGRLSSALGVNDMKIQICHRLGRRGFKPRPLKVFCSDLSQRNELLRSASHIPHLDASLGYRSVFIKPDLSPKEQEIDRRRRLELKSRREAGERDTIRGGQVVLDTRTHTSFRD